MSSIVEVTRLAREIFGLDCTVKYEEKIVRDDPSTFTAMAVRAVVLHHPPGNPHKALDRVEGGYACFESEEPLLAGQGRAVREQLEPRALTLLHDALVEHRAAAAAPSAPAP